MMRFLMALFGLGRKRPRRHMEWHPSTDMDTEQLPAYHKKSMPELIEFWKKNSPRGKATTRKLNEMKQRQTDAIKLRDLQF